MFNKHFHAILLLFFVFLLRFIARQNAADPTSDQSQAIARCASRGLPVGRGDAGSANPRDTIRTMNWLR